MESGHYIEKCVHGIVLSQCRCPGPRTEYVIECPPSCGPKSVVEIEDLRALLAQRDARIAELEAKAYRLTALRQRVMEWHDLIESEQDLDEDAADAVTVRMVLLNEMDAALAAAQGE